MKRDHVLSDIVNYTIMVVFIIIIVASGYCILEMFYPTVCCGNFAESITAITALFALVVACKEYFTMKDVKQAQVLSEYNKRFSEDPNIVKVTKYLNYIDEDGTTNNPPRERPSNYEVEMFMRFFEELELQIKNKRLNKEDVFDLFIYYANKLYTNKPLLVFLGVKDITRNWERFERLMKDYKLYKNKS